MTAEEKTARDNILAQAEINTFRKVILAREDLLTYEKQLAEIRGRRAELASINLSGPVNDKHDEQPQQEQE